MLVLYILFHSNVFFFFRLMLPLKDESNSNKISLTSIRFIDLHVCLLIKFKQVLTDIQSEHAISF